MNAEEAELVNIGYVLNSTDLENPEDRRRFAAWATSNGIKINVENLLEVKWARPKESTT